MKAKLANLLGFFFFVAELFEKAHLALSHPPVLSFH
jgi:hypothetical protein